MFLLIFLIFHLKGTLRQQSPAGREEDKAAASGIAQHCCLNKYSSHTGLFYHQEGVNSSGSSGKAEHSSNPNCISKLVIGVTLEFPWTLGTDLQLEKLPELPQLRSQP